MTGMAAIAICAAITSCSKGENLYDEGQIQQNSVEMIKANYDAAFIATFGQPAANQDWGFGTSRSNTRIENANANEWADPDKAYGGLLVPPAITPEQAAVVKAYFQTVPNLGYKDPQWSNYFIQQVYKGNPATAGEYSPEQYLAADGQNYILASDHMDHLIAIDPAKGITDHINNFNHGDCSTNGDVLDNGEHVGGKHHEDKIMYMMNSTTKSFAYHNSDGSLYHTEYTGLVGWETIHNWAKTNYADYNDCLKDDWNRSYMGFDFEQIVGDDVYAKGVSRPDASGNWQWYPDEYKTFEFEGEQYHYLITNRNQYAADKNEKSFIGKYNNKVTTPGIADFDNEPNSDVKRELLEKGYLPVDGTADKTWVKVGGTADGYFSDWIVTLTEAKTDTPPVYEDVRIIAEDLNAKAEAGDTENSDWDFNDVVFDVHFTDANNAVITLIAAGGTLPLIVGVEEPVNGQAYPSNEVHALFGVDVDYMVNTNAPSKGLKGGAPAAGHEAPTINFSKNGVRDVKGFTIPIYVEKVVNGQNVWVRINAPAGQPAAKIAVKPGFNYCDERQHIKNKYPLFYEWVSNPDVVWYQ